MRRGGLPVLSAVWRRTPNSAVMEALHELCRHGTFLALGANVRSVRARWRGRVARRNLELDHGLGARMWMVDVAACSICRYARSWLANSSTAMLGGVEGIGHGYAGCEECRSCPYGRRGANA
ncbi:hypothetical protein Dimus_005495 [Dionaea muscipula]